MSKFISKQNILRSILTGISFWIWGMIIPAGATSYEPLFFYMRDEVGNKALIRNNGLVYVEDVFVIEIPTDEILANGDSTITVIMEDEYGNKKSKTVRLCSKNP